MTESEPILRFQDVTVASQPPYESAIWKMSFDLLAGDLLLLRLEEEFTELPLADAAEGLVAPTEGAVQFLGRNWTGLSAREAAGARGRIGRVFLEEGWLDDLGVDENIMLAQRHHTRRTEAEIRQEAANLAQMFRLPGLPLWPPGRVRRQDLRKAACIRALLGRPQLILLENPTLGVYADLIAPLVNAVNAARRGGAAVVWATTEARVWDDPGLRATNRCKMFGSQMHRLTR
ncbi:hypothetical protein LBMAG56_17780 [Verrucomicrobiota bacterium]|nr:hypothetical protein LBMAG56_17780 [Verrucomicrobiota bacterium]